MKKVILFAAVVASVAFVSCGKKADAPVVDSTAVDTTIVDTTVVDSTAAVVDSAAVVA
jgi:hypothetical protein